MNIHPNSSINILEKSIQNSLRTNHLYTMGCFKFNLAMENEPEMSRCISFFQMGIYIPASYVSLPDGTSEIPF